MPGDLHRHDEYSTYDGTGKASELAQIAKDKGLTFLGLSNHGNTSGNVLHYDACKAVGIKPIMGVEGYFLPAYKEKTRGYHLCLFAKDLEGYRNINWIQSLGDEQKYYNPIIDFKILKEHHEGVICSSACVAGYIPQCIQAGRIGLAKKAIKKFVSIFGDDFYLEVQPYSISDPGVQEKLNVELIKLGMEMGVKCIMTSDSHRGRKEDLDVYLKMHELKNSDPEYIEHVRLTYAERYMPDAGELERRFIKMHKGDFGNETKKLAKWMHDNLEELASKVSDTILDDLAELPAIPVFDESQDSMKLLIHNVKQGLRDRGCWNALYRRRAKEELNVIKQNHFEDYFLIVQDYVLWAKEHGIGVGPGRGSGCNCIVNYALGITDVDSIRFGLDFRRFIREDKKTLPDIDVDFETARRAEVQQYIVDRYPGHACQIASYGMYKVDNLVNDLIKTYDEYAQEDKQLIKEVKSVIKSHTNQEKQIDCDELLADPMARNLSKRVPLFFEAFKFMYNKVKYIGTHAAGVAITREDIHYYTALRTQKQDGKLFSAYNLVDLERCGVVKYDILGLSTLSSIVEMRHAVGVDSFNVDNINDKQVIDAFASGKCNGIFQYSAAAAQGILREIHTDGFNDVVAASAMNRPGPLSQGIPSIYAESKETWRSQVDKPVYAPYVEDTYGCILYQEQVNAIAVELGGMSWNQADKLRKMDDPASLKSRKLIEENYDPFLKTFTAGMKKHGLTKDEAKDLFDKFLNYSFNKGHAVGYALISAEEMWYKVYYPGIFWYTKLKQTNMDKDGDRFLSECVADGNVVFLAHVNYSDVSYSLRRVEGEEVIQTGLANLKGVGEKAAEEIVAERKAHGIFTSKDNFIDRCRSRVVNARVLRVLQEQGALEFRKKTYITRVTKYNTALYGRYDNT